MALEASHATWHWNKDTDKLEIVAANTAAFDKTSDKEPNLRYSPKQFDEAMLRQKPAVANVDVDLSQISLDDVKNVVLLATSATAGERKMFADFFRNSSIDRFLNGLIIYMGHFVDTVEFLLIRRDDIAGPHGKLNSGAASAMEHNLAVHLDQHRIILAGAYARVSLGAGTIGASTERDCLVFEAFAVFCVQVVWTALHRRAYPVLDTEINRLLRSAHFNLADHRSGGLRFTAKERHILHGHRIGRLTLSVNKYFAQSPLAFELQHVSAENSPLLTVGHIKYNGTQSRLYDLEMEYATPETQMHFVGKHHGLLGHPKKFYSAKLDLDWQAVRREGVTAACDPYGIVTQPCLQVQSSCQLVVEPSLTLSAQPLFRLVDNKLRK